MRENKNKDCREFYNIIKKLGEGNFGIVYEAIKKDSNEKRAIKIIEKDIIRNAFKNTYFKEPTEEDMKPYINCCYNEIRNMQKAEGENGTNENAVKFYECFNNKNEFAIVMELCDDNLLNFLHKIKEEEKYDIINQLNKTIKILVESQLLYMDLKIENILIKFINKEKTKYIIKLKLTDDIGLMKQFKKLIVSSKDNNNKGNICINAPEILKGEEYNDKSDLWSLGIIIYILYFNEYPFNGDESEILDQINKGEKILKKTGNSDLDNLIRGLLKEDPEERLNWIQYFEHLFFYKRKLGSENFRDYYEIGKKIGQTDQATIHIAKVKKSNELRAIKIFDIGKIRNNFKKKFLKISNNNDIKVYIDTFKNEINNMKIVEGINNKNYNTVEFIESYENDNEFAIIMELCDDNLLNIFVKRPKPFNSDEICDILVQLNNSFKLMNENKLIHRALNLENILIKYINEEKTKYIIKLKITNDSCLISEISKSKKTNNHSFFVAPEILKREKYNEKSDLWSLGIIIYTLFFRKYPFNGDTEDEILKEIKNLSKYLTIKTDNSDLDDLLRKLLVENPQKRLTWNQYFKHHFFRQKANVRNFYEIKEKLGTSRFATIYKAKDKETNELRAIKIFDKNKIRHEFKRKYFRIPKDEDLKPYIDGFNNEIKHMKIVEQDKDKKNIYTVKFYEHFHSNDEFAIVMELCDDNLLNLYAKKKYPFNPKKINEILTLLNNSFRIMVQNNLIHRALNLENILIKFENEEKSKYIVKLKLTDDSGLIKDLSEISKLGKMRGNNDLFFISPEILKKEKYNEKCDLWSLGVIIYTLLFREYPYQGNNEIELLKNIKTKNLQIKSGDSNIDDLLNRLLVVDPQKRMTWKEYFNHPFFMGPSEDYKKYYEIQKKIGNAEFATVYKAKFLENNELRAIKIYDKNKIRNFLKRNNLKETTEQNMRPYIESFHNEIKNMKIVEGENNENTVKYFDYFDNKDEFIIAMELCDDSLLNVFAKKQNNFDSQELYDLLVQLNNSFKIMAENKLIHRALNLDNILVKYEDEEKTSYIVKLKLTNDSGFINNLPQNNKIGRLQGDLCFIAPEILERKNYNEKCDLWSLGIIIYILTFREHPFFGENESEILEEINLKENKLKQVKDPILDDLIKKLLVKYPTRRLTWDQYFRHNFFRNRPIFDEGNELRISMLKKNKSNPKNAYPKTYTLPNY